MLTGDNYARQKMPSSEKLFRSRDLGVEWGSQLEIFSSSPSMRAGKGGVEE